MPFKCNQQRYITEVLPRLVNLPPRNEVVKLTTNSDKIQPNPSLDASVILTVGRCRLNQVDP